MSGGAGVNNSSNNLSNQPVKNSGPSISNQNNQNPIPAYQNNYVINFKQSAYAKYAHRVFPGQISAETKSTLSPFTISSLTYPDGHTIVTLHYHKTGYEDVNVTAQPGENVYYIKLPNYEDPGDTGLIVEGTDGNIVPQN